MDDDGAMIGARVSLQVGFQDIEQQVESGVAILVHVNLVAGIPVDPEGSLEERRLHQPLAFVTVEIPVPHLHQLAEHGAVHEELHLLR